MICRASPSTCLRRRPFSLFELEFLWLSPNEATFLPRIRVLGDADPLDLFANYGTQMESTKAAIALLKKALAIPPAFTELERQIHLSAHALEAATKMRSTIAEPGERLFPDLLAVSAAAIATEIGALIDEAHNEGADLSRIDILDSSQSSGSEQLSLHLLRAVRKSWAAQKLREGKLDAQERRNRLMAIEAEFIRLSKAPVIVAGSTGSVAATMALMETLKGRPNAAILLHGLDRNLDEEDRGLHLETIPSILSMVCISFSQNSTSSAKPSVTLKCRPRTMRYAGARRF